MRERTQAGSSCRVIFKHVKSDTLTVEMFFFSFSKQISHCGREIVGTNTYWCLTENQLVKVIWIVTFVSIIWQVPNVEVGKQREFHCVKVSPDIMEWLSSFVCSAQFRMCIFLTHWKTSCIWFHLHIWKINSPCIYLFLLDPYLSLTDIFSDNKILEMMCFVTVGITGIQDKEYLFWHFNLSAESHKYGHE